MSDTDSESDVNKNNDKNSNFELDEKKVRLNRTILIQGISKVNCNKRDPTDLDKQFPRVTHLHLQNKGIDILDSLHHFRNLTVLYLYDNRIHEIEGLEDAKNLEALYLQKNRLERINGLLGCRKLRKLYLGQNEIVVVEGLQSLNRLKELHIEEQRLQQGEHLIFDPITLDTLSASLQILNISGNKIKSLEDLAGMKELHTISAHNNAIVDLDQTSLIMSTIKNIKVIDLRGNPIAKSPKYKEKMIAQCNAIELLDGKSYSAVSCQFIKKFCDMKASHLRQSLTTMNLGHTNSEMSKIFPTNEISSFRQRNSSFDLTQDLPDHQLEQLYPVPPGGDQRNQRFSFSTDDHINTRLTNNSQSQYKSSRLQAQTLDMGYTRQNGRSRLVKPTEITFPQFVLAPKSVIQNGSTESLLGSKAINNSNDLNDLELKSRKPKVIKGLANRGFSAITNRSIPLERSWTSHHSASSVNGMMPSSHSFSKMQVEKHLNNVGSDKNLLTSKEFGDNSYHQKSNSIQNDFSKNPETKVFKLPPWPHIQRNVGSVQNVKFM